MYWCFLKMCWKIFWQLRQYVLIEETPFYGISGRFPENKISYGRYWWRPDILRTIIFRWMYSALLKLMYVHLKIKSQINLKEGDTTLFNNPIRSYRVSHIEACLLNWLWQIETPCTCGIYLIDDVILKYFQILGNRIIKFCLQWNR